MARIMVVWWSRMVTVVMALSVTVQAATQFASRLRKCRVDDKHALNSCLKQTFEDMRPLLSTGIPELSLPPMDPMNLESLVFRQGDGGLVSVSSNFNDVTITGLSNFTTTFVDADPVSRTLSVALTIPFLRVTGRYELSGSFLFLPAEGQGNFWANFDGVEAKGTSLLNIVAGGDGKDRLRVSNTNIDFVINRLSVHLDNLFNGDQVLGPATNLFLNDNGQEILKDIKPMVVVRLNEMIRKVMDDALSQLPVSSFLQTTTTIPAT